MSPGPARASRRLSRRAAESLLVAVAVVVVTTAGLVAAARIMAAPDSHDPGAGSGTRVISVTAGTVRAVDLRGVPGDLTIAGTAGSQVRLTGQLHWSGRAPVAATWLDRASQVLHLSFRCAPASPCTEHYRLLVPRRTALALRQPAGRITASGLAGPVRITAGHVAVSAAGLRSPSLAAVISSGQLTAAFAAAPRLVSVTLTSAQATLRLPGSVGYAVSSQVVAGFIHVGVPQASGAARTVTARIHSGELELLPGLFLDAGRGLRGIDEDVWDD